MKSDRSRPHQWEVCPPGLLHETARQGSRSAFWMLAVGLLLGGGLVAATLVSMESPKPAPEPIAKVRAECSSLRAKIDCFVAGEIKDCSEFKSICCHIRQCCECKEAYNAARCRAKEKGKRQKPTIKNINLPSRAP